LAIQKLNEGPIKTVVTALLDRHGTEEVTEDDILFEIIKYQKLDDNNAKTVFNAMKKLGLENCKDPYHISSYLIWKFALMRNYYTKNEIDGFESKRKQRRGKLF